MVSVPQNYLDRPVPVIGAGTLARRIALMFATRGGLVRIHARNADRGALAVDYVQQQRDELSENRSRMGTRPRRICRELDDAVADALAGGGINSESAKAGIDSESR